MNIKNRKSEERTNVRDRFWPGAKALSDRQDPSSAYLALWARHLDSGIVEITNERELAYEAGYTGNRALRTWQEGKP